MGIDERTIAVFAGEPAYPQNAPFHPSEAYPEYDGPLANETNHAYNSVRNCLRLAGLDAQHYGTEQWNPLADIIHHGETVLVRPNLVRAAHPRFADGWRLNMTNGSVVRAVCDYIWKALGPSGKIIIGDAPSIDSDLSETVRVTGLDTVCAYYQERHLDFKLVDLRTMKAKSREEVIMERTLAEGDPNGYTAFHLATSSELEGHPGAGRYYGADYDSGTVNSHHRPGRHDYLVAGSVFKADVIFTIPKMKTHKKGGVTIALKILVGVIGNKNWLPHHTEPGIFAAGDESPNPGVVRRLQRAGATFFRTLAITSPRFGPWVYCQVRKFTRPFVGDSENRIRSGNWAGNDTIWRTVLDINKIAMYGEADGRMRPGGPEDRKRYCTLVDGIIAGEGRGPCNTDPVPAGLVLFGRNPASMDAACAWLMGFDPERIPLVRNAFRTRGYALAEWKWRDVRVVSNRAEWNAAVPDIPDSATYHFQPHFGWKGRIERTPTAQSAGVQAAAGRIAAVSAGQR